MEKTQISKFEDYTHSPQIKKDVKNEDFRMLIRHLADLCEGLQNMTSGQALPFGVYIFDKETILKKLEDALKFVYALRVAGE